MVVFSAVAIAVAVVVAAIVVAVVVASGYDHFVDKIIGQFNRFV